ncbi:MAG: hypothetical protein MMC23_009841 [Stictis urceolatum]|nr:hypothetical protein [Stictis urceolata]
MPAHLRHQPPMDLRSAARADAAAKDSDSFSFAESHITDSEGELTSAKPTMMQARQLKITTATPVLQQRYQSDEEVPSPSTEGSKDSQEEDFDVEDMDDLEVLPAITATEIAKAIPIVYTGKPTMITISALAPMHKRQTAPTARPGKMAHSGSTSSVPAAIPRRSSLRTKLANRTVSMYEPPVRTGSPALSTLTTPSAINFSAPARGSSLSPRPSPLSSTSPPQLLEPSSPTSSYADSDISSMDEAEACLRESEEIQIRTHSMERERAAFGGEHENDILGKPPTPTSYEAYDPFHIEPPTLSKTKAREDDGRKWKGIGFGRKVRLGRRGREAEAAY